ncbi:MAG: 5'/3'-nucleotidase SurE [candidate division Zixibacteria bacterium]|nr:5'/3'-nucleotidase SurE [candidate division Zixibacteria bacterium]
MAKKTQKRRILITNDDGYFSDGIEVLFKELSTTDNVVMVAPDREQSASSHSLTLSRPLRMHQLDKNRYFTDGTPTDCILLALQIALKNRVPDFIVSGINHGANMGDDVIYSGTVAAAVEGAILKIPSIAVSMVDHKPGMPMLRAARFVHKLLDAYDTFDFGPGTLLNVNLPPDNGKPYNRYQFTRQGNRVYKDMVIRKNDPRGRDYYWIGGHPKWRRIKGSDFVAVQKGLVSLTPMGLEFTDFDILQRLTECPVKI